MLERRWTDSIRRIERNWLATGTVKGSLKSGGRPDGSSVPLCWLGLWAPDTVGRRHGVNRLVDLGDARSPRHMRAAMHHTVCVKGFSPQARVGFDDLAGIFDVIDGFPILHASRGRLNAALVLYASSVNRHWGSAKRSRPTTPQSGRA
jgi:hypothetical protein